MAAPIELDLSYFQSQAPTWRHIARGALGTPFVFKAAQRWGEDVAEFLAGYTDLDYDEDWRPVRPLGKGGFGLVGLWQQFDNKDGIIDSMAIKQQEYDEHPPAQARMTLGTDGLAVEAAIMHQLNRLGNRNIIQLRGFKNNAREKLWRFYFEFAPWGDLFFLRHNYRAWNTYFPEEFLWHVFHGLANAALTLHKGPFRDLTTDKAFEKDDHYLLHFDLKPANILLSDPVDKEAYDFSNFPTIKMADFGLSKLTSPDDRHNPRDYRYTGTRGYRPPEQECLTAHWYDKPEGKIYRPHAQGNPDAKGFCKQLEWDDDEPGYKFRSAHNIWVIGKIMWELLTLRDGDDLNKEMQQVAKSTHYGADREHVLEEIRTTRDPEFSLDLRHLVRECLRIHPGKRPSPRELEEFTRIRVIAMANKVRNNVTGLKHGTRVYYMGNEINDMPVGHHEKGDIPYKYNDFERVKEWKLDFSDPDLSKLRDGRWQPRTSRNTEEKPIVQGGRKRIRRREGYIFLPQKYDSRQVRKVRFPASALEVLVGSGGESDGGGEVPDFGEDSDDDNDEGPPGGWGRGLGKQKPGEEEGLVRLQGREGRGIGGEAVESSAGENVQGRSGRTDGRSSARKRRNHDEDGTPGETSSTTRAKRPRKSGSGEETDGNAGEGVRRGGNDNDGISRPAEPTLQPGQDAVNRSLIRLAGEALAELGNQQGSPGTPKKPGTPSRPSISPITPPRYGGKHLPGQDPRGNLLNQQQPPPSGATSQGSQDQGHPGDDTSGSSDPIRRPGRQGVANRGRGRGRDRGSDGDGSEKSQQTQSQSQPQHQHQQQQPPQQPPPPPPQRRPRRRDRSIIEQDLPTIQVQNIGGRALRQRKK